MSACSFLCCFLGFDHLVLGPLTAPLDLVLSQMKSGHSSIPVALPKESSVLRSSVSCLAACRTLFVSFFVLYFSFVEGDSIEVVDSRVMRWYSFSSDLSGLSRI